MKNKELTVENIDVFCERGVFGIEETKKILQAGKSAGLTVNFHGDELHPMKAAEVTCSMALSPVQVFFHLCILPMVYQLKVKQLVHVGTTLKHWKLGHTNQSI